MPSRSCNRASSAANGPAHCASGVADGHPACPGRSGRSGRDSSPTARTLRLWREETTDAARRMFKFSMLYLTLLFTAMVIDRQVIL